MFTKKKCTFLIEVMDQQNATWQGNVVYTQGKKTRSFRSALELIKMMDEVIDRDAVR